MFGIGSTEFLVILVVALIVMGPDKLPQIARGLGKAISEFKRMSTELHRTINLEVERQEHQERVKQAEEELGFNKAQEQAGATQEASPAAPATPQAPPAPTDEQRAAEAAEKAYSSAMAANKAAVPDSAPPAATTTATPDATTSATAQADATPVSGESKA